MPTEVQTDVCIWPGAIGVESATYSCGHGLSPGQAVLQTNRPPDFVAAEGNLIFSDGNRTLTLRGCRVFDVRYSQNGDSGRTWTLIIRDRRWRWDSGEIEGDYNQVDTRGKLVPRTVRSPRELAELCLRKMGEAEGSWIVDLPTGLAEADLEQIETYYVTGQNAPLTGTNPATKWENEIPAHALARLCERFGRRLIYCPVRDCVVIALPGDGAALPAGGVESQGANISSEGKYDGVGIIGAPVEFQMRLRLEAVANSGDGMDRPIESVAYAPDFYPSESAPLPNAKRWDFPGGVGTFAAVSPDTTRQSYEEAINMAAANIFRRYRVVDSDASNARPPTQFSKKIRVPGYGVITGGRLQTVLQPYKVELVKPKARDDRQQAVGGIAGSPPLTEYYDGHSRKQKPYLYGTVSNWCNQAWWKPVDPAAGPQPYDLLKQNSPFGAKIELDFSVDAVRHLIVFGRYVYKNWFRDKGNTEDLAAYLADQTLRVVPRPADLTLETGVIILDDVTHAPVRYKRWWLADGTKDDNRAVVGDEETGPDGLPVYHGTMPEPPQDKRIKWFRHDELYYGVIGKYRYQAFDGGDTTIHWEAGPGGEKVYTKDTLADRHILYNFTEADEGFPVAEGEPPPPLDCVQRADYYLAAYMASLRLASGETANYIGIRPAEMDGAIMQATYSVGGGATTTVSRNTEHEYWVPPYPTRRMAENLAPDPKATAQNELYRPAPEKVRAMLDGKGRA